MRFQQADILPVALPVALKKVSFSLSHAHSLISARLFWFPKIFPKAWRAAFIHVALAVWECVSWKGPFSGQNQRIGARWPREMVLHWEGGPPQSTEGSQHHGCYLDHGAQRRCCRFKLKSALFYSCGSIRQSVVSTACLKEMCFFLHYIDWLCRRTLHTKRIMKMILSRGGFNKFSGA